MRSTDLGLLGYRPAWERQEQAHARVIEGGEEEVLLVEHPPVITLGRRGNVGSHLLATEEHLSRVSVELVQSDRGGDITFHGPGQLVAYPIVRLNEHRLSVGGYVRTLEAAIIQTLADFGVMARREEGAVGVWVDDPQAKQPAKICAIGVRIRRGVSLHGIALNVTTDLSYFNLIVPCGLTGRPVTSLVKLLGETCPATEQVKTRLTAQLVTAFA